MVTLQLHRPHWIKDDGDDPADQCAHGFVELTVNGVHVCSASDGEWTVSAAALFLLRTVTADHTMADPVTEGNFLIPCCGFVVWVREDARYPCYVFGCNGGVSPEIRHRDGMVQVSLGAESAGVPLSEWAGAVLRFSDQVQAFYDSSMPKDELDDEHDREGWACFWQEWRARRETARRVARSGSADGDRQEQ